MHRCTHTMGEEIAITLSGGVTETVIAIYEERTNFDETDSLANIENFNAVCDFKSQSLTVAPRRGDIVTVIRTSKQYKVLHVEDDGWARHRVYMKEYT